MKIRDLIIGGLCIVTVLQQIMLWMLLTDTIALQDAIIETIKMIGRLHY
jgi:hypothetical protein